MPIDPQVYAEFIATVHNDPKLTDSELLSKFPEFKGDRTLVSQGRGLYATLGETGTMDQLKAVLATEMPDRFKTMDEIDQEIKIQDQIQADKEKRHGIETSIPPMGIGFVGSTPIETWMHNPRKDQLNLEIKRRILQNQKETGQPIDPDRPGLSDFLKGIIPGAGMLEASLDAGNQEVNKEIRQYKAPVGQALAQKTKTENGIAQYIVEPLFQPGTNKSIPAEEWEDDIEYPWVKNIKRSITDPEKQKEWDDISGMAYEYVKSLENIPGGRQKIERWHDAIMSGNSKGTGVNQANIGSEFASELATYYHGLLQHNTKAFEQSGAKGILQDINQKMQIAQTYINQYNTLKPYLILAQNDPTMDPAEKKQILSRAQELSDGLKSVSEEINQRKDTPEIIAAQKMASDLGTRYQGVNNITKMISGIDENGIQNLDDIVFDPVRRQMERQAKIKESIEHDSFGGRLWTNVKEAGSSIASEVLGSVLNTAATALRFGDWATGGISNKEYSAVDRIIDGSTAAVLNNAVMDFKLNEPLYDQNGKLNPHMLTTSIVRSAIDMATLIGGARLGAKLLKPLEGLGMGSKMMDDIGLTLSGVVMQFPQMYDEGRAAGLSKHDAFLRGMATAIPVSAMELIEPNRNMLRFGKYASGATRKTIQQMLMEELKTPWESRLLWFKDGLKEIVKENIQEVSQNYGQYAVNTLHNTAFGKKLFADSPAENETKETMFLTTTSTALMDIFMRGRPVHFDKRVRNSMLAQAADDYNWHANKFAMQGIENPQLKPVITDILGKMAWIVQSKKENPLMNHADFLEKIGLELDLEDKRKQLFDPNKTYTDDERKLINDKFDVDNKAIYNKIQGIANRPVGIFIRDGHKISYNAFDDYLNNVVDAKDLKDVTIYNNPEMARRFAEKERELQPEKLQENIKAKEKKLKGELDFSQFTPAELHLMKQTTQADLEVYQEKLKKHDESATKTEISPTMEKRVSNTRLKVEQLQNKLAALDEFQKQKPIEEKTPVIPVTPVRTVDTINTEIDNLSKQLQDHENGITPLSRRNYNNTIKQRQRLVNELADLEAQQTQKPPAQQRIEKTSQNIKRLNEISDILVKDQETRDANKSLGRGMEPLKVMDDKEVATLIQEREALKLENKTMTEQGKPKGKPQKPNSEHTPENVTKVQARVDEIRTLQANPAGHPEYQKLQQEKERLQFWLDTPTAIKAADSVLGVPISPEGDQSTAVLRTGGGLAADLAKIATHPSVLTPKLKNNTKRKAFLDDSTFIGNGTEIEFNRPLSEKEKEMLQEANTLFDQIHDPNNSQETKDVAEKQFINLRNKFQESVNKKPDLKPDEVYTPYDETGNEVVPPEWIGEPVKKTVPEGKQLTKRSTLKIGDRIINSETGIEGTVTKGGRNPIIQFDNSEIENNQPTDLGSGIYYKTNKTKSNEKQVQRRGQKTSEKVEPTQGTIEFPELIPTDNTENLAPSLINLRERITLRERIDSDEEISDMELTWIENRIRILENQYPGLLAKEFADKTIKEEDKKPQSETGESLGEDEKPTVLQITIQNLFKQLAALQNGKNGLKQSMISRSLNIADMLHEKGLLEEEKKYLNDTIKNWDKWDVSAKERHDDRIRMLHQLNNLFEVLGRTIYNSVKSIIDQMQMFGHATADIVIQIMDYLDKLQQMKKLVRYDLLVKSGKFTNDDLQRMVYDMVVSNTPQTVIDSFTGRPQQLVSPNDVKPTHDSTSEKKLEAQRKSFQRLMEKMKKLGITNPDSFLMRMALDPDIRFNENLETPTSYGALLESLQNLPPDKFSPQIRNEAIIFSKLMSSAMTYDNAIGLGNVFSAIREMEHWAIKFMGKGVTGKVGIRFMNRQNSKTVFSENAKENLENFIFITNNTKYEGKDAIEQFLRQEIGTKEYPGVITELNKQYAEAVKRNNVNEALRLKRAIHNKTLNIFARLTGLDWNNYFTLANKELEGFTFDRVAQQDHGIVFQDINQKLNTITYLGLDENGRNQGFNHGMPTAMSNILSAFVDVVRQQETNRLNNVSYDYAKAMGTFFLEEAVSKDTNMPASESNVNKLANIVSNDIILDPYFMGMKDKPVSTFQMVSQIHKSGYELIEVDGIQMFGENGLQKKEDDRMEEKDILATMLAIYTNDLNNKEFYYHPVGQMGDKAHMYYVKVNKHSNLDQQLQKLREGTFGKNIPSEKQIKEMVGKIKSNLLAYSSYFNEEQSNEKILEEFVKNFIINDVEVKKKLHGSKILEQYKKGFNELVKRASNIASSGIAPNIYVKGGIGENFKVIVSNDAVNFGWLAALHNKFNINAADGVIFVTREIARKYQKGLGATVVNYANKPDFFSFKSIYSYVDEKTGDRSLTKGNYIVIDDLAQLLPDSHFAKILDILNKNGADMMVFKSSAKITTEIETKLFETETMNFLENPEINVVDRKSEHLLYQQDLRYTTVPENQKMPVQTYGLFQNLTNGQRISQHITNVREKALNDFNEVLSSTDKNLKRKFILSLVSPQKDPALYKFLKTGGALDSPIFAGKIDLLLASEFNSRVMDLPTNRVVTQDIPAMDVPLAILRVTKDGSKKLLPPQANCNIEGIRYEETTEFKTKDEVINHILENKEKYVDMFEFSHLFKDGKEFSLDNLRKEDIKIWRLEEDRITKDGNWVIPGELIMGTRVPLDNYHSAILYEAKTRLPGVQNFFMTNHEDMKTAGLDYDGDQRYVNSLFRPDGKLDLSVSTEGLANRLFLSVTTEYAKYENFNKLNNPIDMSLLEKTVTGIPNPTQIDDHEVFTPYGYLKSNRKNMSGNVLKSFLTNINTTIDFIKATKIGLKDSDGNLVYLKDQQGAIKAFIGNIQNAAFDMASSDPVLIRMGINQDTAWAFTHALLTNQRLNSLFDDLDRQIKKIENRPIDEQPGITFIEHSSSGYPGRTRENANADVTIAIATDFNSAGERLTKNSVNDQGKTYIPVSGADLRVTEERVNKIVNTILEKLGLGTVKGVNIYSGNKGLAAVLTNPTELARSKGNLQQGYPIEYNGKNYKDVEEAYKTFKTGNLSTDLKLMTNLIGIKLKTYPKIISAIDKAGGVEFLNNSNHSISPSYDEKSRWTGKGQNSNFIKALTRAYNQTRIIEFSNTGDPVWINYQKNLEEPAAWRMLSNTIISSDKTQITGDDTKSGERRTFNITDQRLLDVAKNKPELKHISLNIAGNGLYTLKGRFNQDEIDQFTYKLIRDVQMALKNKVVIDSIRSGGQTGYDEAGANAGIRLGIPTTILAPKGWRFKNARGEDISNEEKFKNRFAYKTLGKLGLKYRQENFPEEQQTKTPLDESLLEGIPDDIKKLLTQANTAVYEEVTKLVHIFNTQTAKNFLESMENDRLLRNGITPVSLKERIFGWIINKEGESVESEESKELKQLVQNGRNLQALYSFIKWSREVPLTTIDMLNDSFQFDKTISNLQKKESALNVDQAESTDIWKSIMKTADYVRQQLFNQGMSIGKFFLGMKITRDDPNSRNKFRNRLENLLNIQQIKSLVQHEDVKGIYNEVVKFGDGLETMQTDHPGNLFLNALETKSEGFVEGGRIKRVQIKESVVKGIENGDFEGYQNAFQQLPNALKKKFLLYQLHFYGTTMLNHEGGFMNLIHPEYLARTSKSMENINRITNKSNKLSEQERLVNDFLDNLERLHIPFNDLVRAMGMKRSEQLITLGYPHAWISIESKNNPKKLGGTSTLEIAASESKQTPLHYLGKLMQDFLKLYPDINAGIGSINQPHEISVNQTQTKYFFKSNVPWSPADQIRKGFVSAMVKETGSIGNVRPGDYINLTTDFGDKILVQVIGNPVKIGLNDNINDWKESTGTGISEYQKYLDEVENKKKDYQYIRFETVEDDVDINEIRDPNETMLRINTKNPIAQRLIEETGLDGLNNVVLFGDSTERIDNINDEGLSTITGLPVQMEQDKPDQSMEELLGNLVKTINDEFDQEGLDATDKRDLQILMNSDTVIFSGNLNLTEDEISGHEVAVFIGKTLGKPMYAISKGSNKYFSDVYGYNYATQKFEKIPYFSIPLGVKSVGILGNLNVEGVISRIMDSFHSTHDMNVTRTVTPLKEKIEPIVPEKVIPSSVVENVQGKDGKENVNYQVIAGKVYRDGHIVTNKVIIRNVLFRQEFQRIFGRAIKLEDFNNGQVTQKVIIPVVENGLNVFKQLKITVNQDRTINQKVSDISQNENRNDIEEYISAMEQKHFPEETPQFKKGEKAQNLHGFLLGLINKIKCS